MPLEADRGTNEGRSDSDADKNIIYLTISAAELDPDFTLTIDGNKLSFSGKSRAVSSKGTAADVDAKEFKFEYDLFGDVEEVRRGLTGKGVQVVLRKKELSEEYWPRLTKEKGKNSRISTDWSKWVDEDEQDGEAAVDVSSQSTAINFVSVAQTADIFFCCRSF